MNHWKELISAGLTLFICVLNGYSMGSYRMPPRRSYAYFALVTVFCLFLNSFILIHYGRETLQKSMLVTIALPYFFLILLITEDRISQTWFNFWLWINIFNIIANLSEFANDYIFKNHYIMTVFRFTLFCGYFVLYHNFLKKGHRMIIEKLKVNWWIVSFIPMFFTFLIWMINFYSRGLHGITRNYPVLLTVFTLMLLVYLLMFYTFKTAYDAMEQEWLSQSMKEQILLQKEQYRFYLQKAEAERIFRHDARHRDMLLLNYLETGDLEGAKRFLNKELEEMSVSAGVVFCENILVNAVLTEYQGKAQKKGLEFLTQIQMADILFCDEVEFCVLLCNFLENSLEAAKSYIEVKIKPFNHQIVLNIKNDYSGERKRDADGWYMTTKQHGSGLGLKSAGAILKKNQGFMKIDDKNGVFDVSAAMKN